MAPKQTPKSGRRRRAQPEDDSLSSPTHSPSTVALSSKKRRLESLADSPRSTPKGFSAITSALGGVQNGTRRPGGARNKPENTQDNATGDSEYDVPNSDGEESERFAGKPRKLDFGKRPKISRPKQTLYDVPDSGDEPDPIGETDEQDENIPVTPSKRKSINGDPSSPSVRSASRKQDTQASRSISKTDGVTPRKRGRPAKAKAPEVKTVFPLAVKARIYGQTGKGTSDMGLEPPKLKGILSPQKKKPGRTTKTVIFESDDGGSTTFESGVPSRPILIPTTRKPQRLDSPSLQLEADMAKGNEGAEEGDDEDGEDDEVCAICSKPDSEPPNEIIFCEVCDSGFHQKCYNVPVIPEGDWICRTCSQDDILPDRIDITEKKSAASAKIPEIPNFESHLKRMQRVLLDRCAGNRRIKLRGQDEAYDKAYQLVEQTVVAGEGNSMMVIGGRGCGKTIVGLL